VKEIDDIITGPEVLRRWREEVGTIPGVKTLGFEGATGPGGVFLLSQPCMRPAMMSMRHELSKSESRTSSLSF
ncbi:MAG: hypothetical protein R6V77_01020, partial [Candidatus Cloacimonadaceae bacterium]